MSKQPWLFCEAITQMRQEGSPASSGRGVQPLPGAEFILTGLHVSPGRRETLYYLIGNLIFFFFYFFLWGWLKDVQGTWTLLGAGLIRAKNSPTFLGSRPETTSLALKSWATLNYPNFFGF